MIINNIEIQTGTPKTQSLIDKHIINMRKKRLSAKDHDAKKQMLYNRLVKGKGFDIISLKFCKVNY